MSKKSYKRYQNRLYREIKRRIIAEQKRVTTLHLSTCERKIETLKIRNMLPNYLAEQIDFVKQDMANRITNKLIGEGYIEFRSYESSYDTIEIEAILNIVRPMTQ